MKDTAIFPEEDSLTGQFKTALRKKGFDGGTINIFQEIIYGHYHRSRRVMPWRKTRNPYRVLVSEIMLQQTRVDRVLNKYTLFITTFPDFRSLAAAPLSVLLAVWQGLGYNRRAIALKRTAEKVIADFGGKLPSSRQDLLTLPGIGEYTASAMQAFAFDLPTIFIETNIRRVFIHFFFSDRVSVRDSAIMPLLEQALDRKNPREWYYALMDYGAMLGRKGDNPNRRSALYRKQTPFSGSNRQMRGAVLRTLIDTEGLSKAQIVRLLKLPADKIGGVIGCLEKEGFLRRCGRRYLLS